MYHFKNIDEMTALLRITLISIPLGEENALTSKKLTKIIGCSDSELRLNVSRLIKEFGFKIASGTKGFYLIQTEDERKKAMRNLASRIYHLSKRIQALKTDEELRQMTIDDIMKGNDYI